MSTSTPAELEVVNVSKRLGAVAILRNLSLKLGPGAVHGVVGANGSGKSTLLKLLSGQLAPDAGSISLCGQPLAQRSWTTSHADARRYVSLLPDQNEALLELTGFEFLNLHYALRGIVPTSAEAATEDALGLTEFAGRRLQVLSQGQRKRVHLAGSLAGQPAVWLLDEPTNALDAQTCNYLTTVVERRRTAGLITLAVTHDERALERWDAAISTITALQHPA
jgi:ABC-type multidrug transport system ATPase subunit